MQTIAQRTPAYPALPRNERTVDRAGMAASGSTQLVKWANHSRACVSGPEEVRTFI